MDKNALAGGSPFKIHQASDGGGPTQKASHHVLRISRVIERRRLAAPALDLHCGCSPDHCATTGCAFIVQYLAGIWKSVWILNSRHCPGSAIRHVERMMLSIERGSWVALATDYVPRRYPSAPVPGPGKLAELHCPPSCHRGGRGDGVVRQKGRRPRQDAAAGLTPLTVVLGRPRAFGSLSAWYGA